MRKLAADQVCCWKGRVVDVRGFDEFASERLPQAECVPLERVLTAAGQWAQDEELLLMCKMGMRSAQAAEQLEKVGFRNVHMVEGGLEACKKAGVEVIRARGRISVMRQVMIGAGLLLLAGLILSHIHPWFLLIDWFVACGLTMAGLTGFCPMAKILERMPWNRTGTCGTASCG